jgi:hypothetical protein
MYVRSLASLIDYLIEGDECRFEVFQSTISLARAYGFVGQHEKKKELLYRAGQLQERYDVPTYDYLRG